MSNVEVEINNTLLGIHLIRISTLTKRLICFSTFQLHS